MTRGWRVQLDYTLLDLNWLATNGFSFELCYIRGVDNNYNCIVVLHNFHRSATLSDALLLCQFK